MEIDNFLVIFLNEILDVYLVTGYQISLIVLSIFMKPTIDTN